MVRKQLLTLCLFALLGATIAPVSASHAEIRDQSIVAKTSFDISNRQAVIDSYMSEFLRTEPPSEFSGDVATCNPGTTSNAYQQSVLQRVNWFRNMAGLPNVVYNQENHAAAQAGALISFANKELDHTPDPTARCYSDLGYKGTSSSNLALGVDGVDAINAYIADYGANNIDVGHRRWILHTSLRSIATGDVVPSDDPDDFQLTTNALYVFDTGDAVTPRDGGVAWPPPGYVPEPVVYARWSYVQAGADFSNAQVTVTGPNGSVPVVIESRENFLDPGIVFVPNISKDDNTSDLTYNISITNVSGVPNSTINYSTTLISINHPPRIQDFYSSGHQCSVSSVRADFSFWDWEDDSFTVRPNKNDKDMAYFTVKRINIYPEANSWYAYAKNSLPLTQKSFTLSFTLTDKRGASQVVTPTIVLKEPNNKTLCAPISPKLTQRKNKTVVSWSSPELGAKPESYTVTVMPGNKRCVTRKTSCVLPKLKKGRYTVKISATKKGLNSATTSSRVRLR